MLAKALEREGWSVWWDPKIPPGKTFDEVIEQALEQAKCIIVMWSKKSVTSRCVKAEAAEGNRRGMLVPALLEDEVKIPLEFRYQHASRLTDWEGQSGYLEFEELKKTVAQFLVAATSIAGSTSNLSPSGVPVAGTTDRTRLNEKVPDEVQADPKRPPGQAEKAFRKTILPARVIPFVLAGIVSVLVARYAWIHWAKAPNNRGEAPLVSKPEPPKNPGEASGSNTPEADPQESRERPKNQPLDKRPIEQSPVYLDSATGLLWTKSDNGQDFTWPEAQQYCEDLRLVGHSDWRLPTIEELERLSDPKEVRNYKIRKPFELTEWWVWSSTKEGSGSAWGFAFHDGKRSAVRVEYSLFNRALCVRRSGG